MKRWLTAALLLFAMASTAAAQSGDAIIKRHIKAIGGEKAARAAASVRIQGDVLDAAGGSAGAFLWQTQRPNLFYLEVGGDDGFTEASNGRTAWREDKSGGLRTLTGPAQSRARSAAAFRADRLLNYKKEKIRATALGPGAAQKRPALLVQLTTASGIQRKLFFDTENYLLLKEEQETDDGREEILYGDFRAVGGLLFPHHIEIARGGRGWTLQARQVRLDAPVETALFDFPSRAVTPNVDVVQLLKEVEQNSQEVNRLQENYAYNVTDTDLKVDGKGNVTEKSERTYEIFHIGDTSYWKLVAKDGKPLSESDARKEQEKAEKFIREYEESRKKDAARKAKEEKQIADGKKKKKDDDDDITIADFFRISQFTNPRRERFRGQDVIVFEFQPRPGYKPRGRAENLIHKLTGAVWIDAKEKQVARLEARLADSFRMGGGLVASLGKGSAVVLEQELVRGEVWLPSYAEINLSARVFLVAGMKFNKIQRFSNYQRFNVETKSEVKPPAP